MTQAEKERVPIEPGFFTIPSDPAESPSLLGTRCRSCGEVFFPRRKVCANCLSQDAVDALLGPRGTLYTYTYVHLPMFGTSRTDSQGYGVGQVDLPEGPRVQAVLSGGPEDFHIGMDLELELETLRENRKGQDVVIFRFRPLDA